jgi:hypothetical protein
MATMPMKIEYLHEGSADCPLIRIYGDDAAAVVEMNRAIGRLADGTATQFAAHELPGFHSVGGCALTLAAQAKDRGILVLGLRQFRWVLASSGWSRVAGFVEPFTKPMEHNGHQWLCGKEAAQGLDLGHISVLISNSIEGRW